MLEEKIERPLFAVSPFTVTDGVSPFIPFPETVSSPAIRPVPASATIE
jgi:hypothetical protein